MNNTAGNVEPTTHPSSRLSPQRKQSPGSSTEPSGLETAIVSRSMSPGLASLTIPGAAATTATPTTIAAGDPTKRLPTASASLSKEMIVFCAPTAVEENSHHDYSSDANYFAEAGLSPAAGTAQNFSPSYEPIDEDERKLSISEAKDVIGGEPVTVARRAPMARDNPLCLPRDYSNAGSGTSDSSGNSRGPPAFPFSLVLPPSTSESELLVAEPTPRSESNASVDLLKASTEAIISGQGFRPNPLLLVVRSSNTQNKVAEITTG
jgi:hypothetical protein